MNVLNLDDIIKLNPFKHMGKVKINANENCILGNGSFIKVDFIRNMPKNVVKVTESIKIRDVNFTLLDLLYSPFHFQQSQNQYLLPSFVLKSIDISMKKNNLCKYYVNDLGNENGISILIFIPTLNINKYIIIGLRFKKFWSIVFNIN
ncbi:protein F15 [BeAn 58058 virus]|uniref:protein F15 n=1 Tax=BeAn 58058 virus TaxID=67082 RepID=UPI00090C3D0D|nr:protein F15 [BeAn 58058 virus]APG58236.1 protein F15 [BeAn 58058 virus]